MRNANRFTTRRGWGSSRSEGAPRSKGVSRAGRSLRSVFGAALLLATTSACGLSVNAALPYDVQPGSIERIPELEGVQVTVGSKDFTEQIVLGYIAQLALEAAGANTVDMTNISGSNSSRYALEDGQLQLQWEYTGAGWMSYLGNDEPVDGEQAQYEAVRRTDLRKNEIVWLPYSQVNNTYAFATTERFAREHDLHTTTDMTNYLKQNPREAEFCVETEFASRPDGMPGVRKEYGFPVANAKTFGTGAVYAATARGMCNFGEVFTTDGRISGLNLRVLEDDKRFFPEYNASVTVRKDFYDAHPQIADAVQPVAEELDNNEIMELNRQVDVEGRDASQVAYDWMRAKGFIR